MVSKVATKVNDAFSAINYRVNQFKHIKKNHRLSPIGYQIVQEINHEGVAVVPIEKLNFTSTTRFLDAAKKACKDLKDPYFTNSQSIEYDTGFKHCIPINPTQIAKKYPELYLWGLDEKLLDIIEKCIGLPIAYHGVIVRKEIVDSQQIGSRIWHKDMEDFNIIRVSIYLSDVLDDTSGPFEYIPRHLSASYKDFKWLFRQGESNILDKHMQKVVPSSKWKTCKGPAGTVIFGAVAKIFHHGKIPLKERIAASYYYTSRNPTNEELCLTNSFQKGIPLITAPLTKRQRECLWRYQELLPE